MLRRGGAVGVATAPGVPPATVRSLGWPSCLGLPRRLASTHKFAHSAWLDVSSASPFMLATPVSTATW